MFSVTIKRYFLTGLLVITPIWGTVLVLKTLFVTVDSILGNMLADIVTEDYYVPGLGILTLVLLIFLAGMMATNFLGGRLVKRWEEILDRVPIVRGIYATLKSMMDILSFKQREKYNKVVMIQFPKDGNYVLAFVTGETRDEVQKLAPEPLVHVYVPTSPNPTSGYFLLVPEREVESVDMSVEEAMKLIVSGGLYSSGKTMGVPTIAPEKGHPVSGERVGVKTG
ncbi:DUF502 domain-containing protein [Candidatus Nitronereus thalassa]|uniref:DUF502 domain-containing protein n=1 Tax=Candidatus Nitronereus thalassa TaxID=3020898 RepID=A0ABU3K5J1_9BACT|nr:DUF502 domain-containing protein [Candidatus Nitronereus thalassa]MDT7041643.1 DUF502 domain-containing protein [Candidatus Nitronereus thalassa]